MGSALCGVAIRNVPVHKNGDRVDEFGLWHFVSCPEVANWLPTYKINCFASLLVVRVSDFL
jgi:hypothetical protein